MENNRPGVVDAKHSLAQKRSTVLFAPQIRQTPMEAIHLASVAMEVEGNARDALPLVPWRVGRVGYPSSPFAKERDVSRGRTRLDSSMSISQLLGHLASDTRGMPVYRVYV
jgi:hypothetical protein